MLDYDITRCGRKCHSTGREIKPGEDVYSVLLQQGGDVVRQDFCREAWEEPPENCVGWWKTRIPKSPSSGNRMAPPKVLVQLFDRLSQHEGQNELRFVLALLMMRKKLLKESQSPADADGGCWSLNCPLNGKSYEVEVIAISPGQAEQLQQSLVQLLYGDTEYGDTEYDVDETEDMTGD